MIEKICNFLTNKIRKENPEIDDEKAEVINYGLQNLIGEFPKIFIVFGIAYLLGIFKEAFITCLILLPYKSSTGGFHLKTHIACLLVTTLFYCGIPFVATHVVVSNIVKYILALAIWSFGMAMCKVYAPADTENVPILRKKDRMIKQVSAYIFLTIGIIVAVIIKNESISNIILFGYFIQTLTITKIAYRITNTKYGYEVHGT